MALAGRLSGAAGVVDMDATNPVVKARYAETVDELAAGAQRALLVWLRGKYKKCCGRILAQ